MNKVSMIRAVVKDDAGMTNATIKNMVKAKFNTIVEANLIHYVLGNESDRTKNSRHIPYLKDKAKDFIVSAGDYRTAQRILALAGGEM
jgi:hypothetical protein